MLKLTTRIGVIKQSEIPALRRIDFLHPQWYDGGALGEACSDGKVGCKNATIES
jgi:hypothetical protein